MYGLYVIFYRFSTVRYRFVDLDVEFYRRITRDIAFEIGRDFNRYRDIVRTYSTIKFVIIGERRLFDKVTGIGEVECLRLVIDGLVAVEYRKA